MADTNTNTEFFTRIQLKYDTWENWDAKKDTLKLLKGEIAIVDVPATKDLSQENNANDESAILIKIGDGATVFGSLPWLSAKAADVYSWAKQDETSFLNWLANSASTTFATDAELTVLKNTVYTTASVNGKILTLTKGDGKNSLDFDASQPSAGEDLGLVKSGGNVTISGGIITVKDDSHTHDGRYYTETEIDTKIQGINNKFTTLNGDYDDEGSIKKIATEAIAHALTDADEDFDTLKEMSDWIAGHPDDVTTMNSNIGALATALGDDYVNISDDGTSITAGELSVTTAIDNLDNKINGVDNTIKGLTYTGPNDSNDTATAFVTTVSQANGQISASKAKLPTASIATAGIVKLNDTLTSDLDTEALTAKQGKALNVRINSVDSRIDGLKADNPTASGTSTTFISTIKQVDGKITATAANLPTTIDNANKLNNVAAANYALKTDVTTAINAINANTISGSGPVVTGVTQEAGKITVTKGTLTLDQVGENTESTYVIFNCGTASKVI